MRYSKDQRLLNAFLSSFFIIGAGVVCLFLQIAVNYLPIVIGGIMLIGALLMRDSVKEKNGGFLLLMGTIFLLLIASTIIGEMVDTNSLHLGNVTVNFGIFERAIVTTLFILGGTYGFIGGIDGMAEKDVLLKQLEQWKLPHITMALNAICTSFTFLWVAFYLAIVRLPIESLLFFPMAVSAMAAFFIAWWALNRQKAIHFIILGNTLCAILFGFLSLLNFIYFPLSMLNVLSNGALIATTSEERTFWPRFKKRDKLFEIITHPIWMIPILMAVPVVPFLITKWPATTMTVSAGNQAKVMEISWAYGSEQTKGFDWITKPEVLQMINDINGNQSNWGINISITFPLVREVFNSTVANIMKNLTAHHVTYDVMPVVDSSQFGHSDEYIHDDDIIRFTYLYHDMRKWMIDNQIINQTIINGVVTSETKLYRAIIIDLERTQQIDAGNLVLSYMSGLVNHVMGSNALISLVNEMKVNHEFVAGAFFDFHIYDFVDNDDAQQDFFKISIVPPTNWDYMATMVYQSGPGSNASVLAYCNDINYHFGNRGVPYLVTMNSSYQDILTRLRIAKFTGFPKIGCWAMHELFFNGTKQRPDQFGVKHQHYSSNNSADLWTPAKFIQLHKDLAENNGVSFTFDQYESNNEVYSLVALLDMWLIQRPVYTSWPIMGTRLPNSQFDTYLALCIVTYIILGFLAFYIAWDPFHKKPKEKSQRLDDTTAILLGNQPGDVV